jgi:SAM-dependent methyltransferase
MAKEKPVTKELYLHQNLYNWTAERDIYYQRHFANVQGKILDFGCGNGNFVSLDRNNIVGVDTNRKYIDFCKKRKLEVKHFGGKSIDFADNTFSAINCHDVFEYVLNPEEIIRAFLRVLKPGGKLILMTNDIEKFRFKFWADDYMRRNAFGKKSLVQFLLDNGFERINVKNDYLYHGTHYLCRKGLNKRFILFLEDFIHIFLKSPFLIATAYKPK